MKHISGFCFGIILALIQLTVYAQMQGQMTQSAIRSTPIFVSGTNSVHIQNYSDNRIVSVCKSGNKHNFLLTEAGVGTISYVQLNNLDTIDNFRIFDDYLYFCGRDSGTNVGYVAFANIDSLFANLSPNIYLHRVINTCEVLDLEVYKDNNAGSIKVAAIGKDTNGTYYLVDYDIWNNGILNYRALKTPYILQAITQTDTDIDVVFTKPGNPYAFGVSCHDKTDLSAYTQKMYNYAYSGKIFNDMIRPCFLVCSNNKDRLYISTTIEGQQTSDYGTQGIETGVFTIDLANGLDLTETQIVPTESKVFLKDMKYSSLTDKIYLLAFAYLGNGFGDNILELDMAQTGSYMCDYNVPHNSSYLYLRNNSISLYDNGRYYIVAGIDVSDSLCFFDKYVFGSSAQCSDKFSTKVFFNPPILYTIAPIYNIYYYPKNISNHVPFFHSATLNIDCVN